jgi:hypothetical protein
MVWSGMCGSRLRHHWARGWEKMNPHTVKLSRLRTLLHAVRTGHLPEYHEVFVHHEGTRFVCSRCPAHSRAMTPHIG